MYEDLFKKARIPASATPNIDREDLAKRVINALKGAVARQPVVFGSEFWVELGTYCPSATQYGTSPNGEVAKTLRPRRLQRRGITREKLGDALVRALQLPDETVAVVNDPRNPGPIQDTSVGWQPHFTRASTIFYREQALADSYLRERFQTQSIRIVAKVAYTP